MTDLSDKQSGELPPFARMRLDPYLECVGRLEPDVVLMDTSGTMTSIAISMRRIADALQYFKELAEKEHKK